MLAFIHVAKTGGRTVETLLASSFGIGYAHAVGWRPLQPHGASSRDHVVPKYDVQDYRRLRRICPVLRCIGGHAIALWSGIHEVEPVRYFALLREPLRRGASHYQYHVRHEDPHLDWDEWVRWPVHHDHQVKMFSRGGDVDEAIRAIERHDVFVGLTERFDESLVMLQKLVDRRLNISYRRVNTARDNSLADALLGDARHRDQLRSMYSGELSLYDYVARELYPRLQREYGPTLTADVDVFRRRRDRVNRANLIANRAYRRFIIEPVARRHRRRYVEARDLSGESVQ